MKLASKLRVLLDCRHELRLHLLEGKLSFFFMSCRTRFS